MLGGDPARRHLLAGARSSGLVAQVGRHEVDGLVGTRLLGALGNAAEVHLAHLIAERDVRGDGGGGKRSRDAPGDGLAAAGRLDEDRVGLLRVRKEGRVRVVDDGAFGNGELDDLVTRAFRGAAEAHEGDAIGAQRACPAGQRLRGIGVLCDNKCFHFHTCLY